MRKPPVVAVLGHIDHGKTSLLDAIRKGNVTAKEAGGITQSIGAYQIKLKTQNSKLKTAVDSITFIDTPGHQAFEKMRSHGAKAADIALLVVAADEGVKPQTIEAIEDIKKAEIPLIVVFNKIDKTEANPDRVKQELATAGVMVEGWGGQVSVASVSATKGQGIKELLDLILLTADVEGIEVDENKPASGTIIASGLDAKRGVAATVVVKEGTLHHGDWITLQSTYGKVKKMEDAEGKALFAALPSAPVSVLGLKGIPEVGERFVSVASEKEAEQAVSPKVAQDRHFATRGSDRLLSFVVKAREKASLDALVRMILESKAAFPDVVFHVAVAELGDISTSDLDAADHFHAIILGFQVGVSPSMKMILKQRAIPYHIFPVIYQVPEIIQQIVAERFIKANTPQVTGELTILATFIQSKKGQVVGGKVTEGLVKRNAAFEIKRGETIMGKGKIVNLQQDKKDVASVAKGKECGLLTQSDVPLESKDVLVFWG